MDHEDAEAALLVLLANNVVILGSLLQDLHQLCRLLSKGGTFRRLSVSLVTTMEALDPGPLLAPVRPFLLLGVLYGN